MVHSLPSVYIENLGCAKNQVDAEIMGNRLEAVGWRWVDSPQGADLILVNTCAFIEPAQEESVNTTLDLVAEYPETPVAVTGCLAQRFGSELASEMPELAGVFGNRSPRRIDEFVRRIQTGNQSTDGADGSDRAVDVPGSVGGATTGRGGPVVWLPDDGSHLDGAPRPRLLSLPGSAFLKVAEGCNHHCSFCAIPSIRGALRGRDHREIRREFRELRKAGVFEINLVAQDLAAIDRTSTGGIVSLLKLLLAEPGSFWIRLLYVYPDTFPEEILAIAQRDPRLVPYFDLSFQHASPSVLRRMGRPGDAATYLDLIDRVRTALPDVALRSSFIVGFPGETEDDVERLEAFVRASRLEWVGVFAFSPQDGTAAARMVEEGREALPSPDEVERRRERVMQAHRSVVGAQLARFVGRTLPVLVEEPFARGGLALARAAQHAPDVDGLVVIHDGAHLKPGDVAQVCITGVAGVDMQARLVSS